VTLSRLSLLGFVAFLVACNHETPTEPRSTLDPHLGSRCDVVASAVDCIAYLNGVASPVSSFVLTWSSSDPSIGTFTGGIGTATAPARLVPSRRGEVTLWAHAEFQVQGRNYASDSFLWTFLLDPASPARYVYYLAGNVTAAGGTGPVVGAEVRILDGYAQGKRAITDTFGSFRIDGILTNETFTISASAAGYQPQTRSHVISPPIVPADAPGNPSYLSFQLLRSP